MEPEEKIRISDVMTALDAIVAWTQAVRLELQDYLEQGGADIELATPKSMVGSASSKIVEAARSRGAYVGRAC